MDFDIIIIGAGIAGLSAGWTIARHEAISAAIIENRAIGSNNPSPLTFADVVNEFQLEDCCKETYSTFTFHNHGGSSVEYVFNHNPLVVLDYRKACLQLYSLMNDRDRSLVFVEGQVQSLEQAVNKITVNLKDRPSLSARIVIDASGRSQLAARTLIPDRLCYYSHVYGGEFSNVNLPERKLCCFLLPHGRFGSGGGWFYSIGRSRASFGYATITNSAGKDTNLLKRNFLAALNEFAPYSDYLREATLETVEYGVIPITYAEHLTNGGILIVGDAAGMATNWTCMGVEPGLKYGRLAGEIAATAVLCNNFSVINDYELKWFAENRCKYNEMNQMADRFWFNNYYSWEWIIKNDLAYLKTSQILNRIRYNDYIPNKLVFLKRAIKFKINSILNREFSNPIYLIIKD